LNKLKCLRRAKSFMKKIFILIATGLLLIGCGNKRGELVGVKQKKWFPEKPFGMTLVEGGAYIMGKADDDMAQLQNAQAKTVTVRSFYMDETEITNSEYRQFVYWVRDSIALQMLADKVEELNEEVGTDGIGAYAFADADTSDISVFQRYMKETYYDDNENTYANRPLNWDEDIEWGTEDYVDLAYVEVMDELYLPPEVWYNGEMKLDVNKLKFRYRWFDAEQAALDRKKDPNLRGRSDYIYEEDNLEIYPDTTVWIKDFNYSYNEPMHNDYFSHPAYQDYPVVGVSWDQAVAFCVWRTSYKNSYQKASNKPLVNYFRLPTEAEWEYAARGGIPSGIYPWGSPYLLNDRGCFLANFKPLRGDYSSDQAMYTVEAKSYLANDYNLYNMAGNVAEWTGSSYDPGAYEYVSSLNPNLSLSNEKRKVVRGGSWKDVAYFLRVSSRDYEYKDTSRSYIGFRTVQDYLGSEKVKIK